MSTSKVAKQSKAKTPEPDEGQLESEILSVIEEESHRPSAIANALRRKYCQNSILKALLKLEKEGKVERESKKAWIAKGRGKGKEKEIGKEKEKEKNKEEDKSKK